MISKFAALCLSGRMAMSWAWFLVQSLLASHLDLSERLPIYDAAVFTHIFLLAVMVLYELTLMHVRYTKTPALEEKFKRIDVAVRLIVIIPVSSKCDSLTKKTGATPRLKSLLLLACAPFKFSIVN